LIFKKIEYYISKKNDNTKQNKMTNKLTQSEFIIITAQIMEKMEEIQIENELIDGSKEKKIALFIKLCKLYLSKQGILFLMMTLPEIKMHRNKVLREIMYFDEICTENAYYTEISKALKDLLVYINLGNSCEELLEELEKD
jgi:hypothetical protein